MRSSYLLASTALAALVASAAFAQDALTFAPIDAPETDEAKREVRASPTLTVDGEEQSISYHTILRTGETAGTGVFGQIMDQNGEPIMGGDGAPMMSNSIDFSSILQKDGKLYTVSHFETRPAAVYVTEVTRDEDTGELSPVSTAPVDFSADGGLWVPCAGSVTPWGTHLGSEEYEPDAEVIETTEDIAELDDYAKPMGLYFGYDASAADATMDGFREVFKPYRYGYITEVSVEDDGSASGVKHYAMGRFSHELGYVMPDGKTAYLTDDGTNVGFYRFVADAEGELDAGTLYAMKWNQTSAENGGSADIEWIDLGHADSAAIKAIIDENLTFSDIFDKTEQAEDGSCGEGFTGSVANGVRECLKVKPGMELAASRLETRRYAAIMGATTEIRKEEGVTYDRDSHRLYVGISEISNGMEDTASKGEASPKYDGGGANHIRVDYNPCGGVYSVDLDDAYVGTKISAMVLGKPANYAEDSPYVGNTCDIDGLANPDNVSYVPGAGMLLIGEDTETGHQNDAVWAYDIASGGLSRIMTTPYGAETTSVYFYPDVNGHAYLMAVVQHPYGESDEDKLTDASQSAGYLGYIGPMPALN